MERIYAFLVPTIKHLTNLQMKGIDLGKKLLAAALVMVTVLCVTRMDDDYTSANRTELGHGVLISNPIQTDGSMHNLRAGVFDWKIWGYVGDGFRAYENASQKVFEGAVYAVKRVADIVPQKSELAAQDQKTRTNALLANLDQ